MQPIAPILCTSLPAAICVASHYFPWRFWFRRGRLPRPLAYTVGLLAVLLPVTVAAALAAETVAATLGLLWLGAGSAALGTLIPWWWDGQRRVELRHQDAADQATWGDYAE